MGPSTLPAVDLRPDPIERVAGRKLGSLTVQRYLVAQEFGELVPSPTSPTVSPSPGGTSSLLQTVISPTQS